jgi:hypothetical protein
VATSKRSREAKPGSRKRRLEKQQNRLLREPYDANLGKGGTLKKFIDQ